MSSKTPKENEQRFFEQVPDLPPERLRAEEEATDYADVDLESIWGTIRADALDASEPPSLEGISAGLAARVRMLDRNHVRGIGEEKKKHTREAFRRCYDDIRNLGPTSPNAAEDLSRCEREIEEVLLVGTVVRVRGTTSSDNSDVVTSPEQKRLALLGLLAWLESLY